MSPRTRRRRDLRDDTGSSLVLALAVMLAIGGILGGLITYVTSSTKVSVALESSRNRQYAADAALEQAIRFVQTDTTTRALMASGCSSARPFFTPTTAINGYSIRVDCAGAPSASLDSLNRVVIQRNVLFLACIDTGAACSDSSAIIRAKVNFPTNAAGLVVGAFVQSWSVTK